MEIQLTETVDCCKIEYLITKFYSKSKAKKIESVKFNAQNLEFIDAWSAVILLVWQSSLVELGKKVEFIAPDKSYSRKFFVNSNFEKCINRISVNCIGFKYGDYNLEQIKSEYDDILPFMVFNKKHSFEDYYSKLKSDKMLIYLAPNFATCRSGPVDKIRIRQGFRGHARLHESGQRIPSSKIDG